MRSHPFFTEPVEQRRIIIILAAITITLAANIIGLLQGITYVFPHLLYLPILLAGYWYPRHGTAIALLIAALYAGAALLLTPPELITTISILARAAVFIAIGLVVSFLTIRLRQSEEQLHDLIEFLPDATFAIDREGRVIAWNRAIEKLTGVPKMKIIGKGESAYAVPFYGEKRPILIDYALRRDPAIEALYEGVSRNGDAFEAEVIAPMLHDGRGAHLRCVATPLYDSGREIAGAVESIRDITGEVMARSALRNTNRQLKTISGIIRHGLSKRLEELYRHLTIGSMQISDPASLSVLRKIEGSADGIRRQIAISRDFREIGAIPPVWIPVQEAVHEAAARLDTKGMVVHAWTERLSIFSDPHLRTAISHLIENARAAGATALLVTYQIREDGCAIILEDNGTGIADDEKERLFAENIERSGHGLFLAREILGITGIGIHEEGESGRGARFVLTVPPEGYRIM
ncbi:PAS domain S-box-containing protein [Methanocalculus alkaliphilus]|uniref:PAS domain S-box protein n=1 Tax=Methanocalculus alkaliphilus TaxID=768730 RepID=UPI00209DF71C|nr:PAS domain S-box protein [Methanocalculus alkaliphilus]MCP1715803.1 PAS domain S-box-containing protein [Methanocalculus alkaliphilus]